MKRASEGRVPELRCCRLASHRVSARHRDKAQATAPQILLCLAGVAIGSLFVLELHRTATTPDEVGRAERGNLIVKELDVSDGLVENRCRIRLKGRAGHRSKRCKYSATCRRIAEQYSINRGEKKVKYSTKLIMEGKTERK